MISKTCNCKPDKISLKIVVIPASMGGEYGTMKPHNGAYYDTVVGYEADGAVFFYDSKGAYILLEPGGYDELLKRVDGLEEAVAELRAQLAEEIESRQRADEVLESKLEDEIAERKAADNLLNDSITAEAEERARQDEQTRTALQMAIEAEETARKNADTALEEKISEETTSREEADAELSNDIIKVSNNLQTQIDALADRSDVVDVVGTHEELEGYDTSNLGDNDIVKVLNDETHDGAITYYRWDKAGKDWAYVGETGPYYTKAETDEKLQSIDHDIENLTELMPAVVQETGDSEHDVMSQKAVTEALANAGGGLDWIEDDAENSAYLIGKDNQYTHSEPLMPHEYKSIIFGSNNELLERGGGAGGMTGTGQVVIGNNNVTMSDEMTSEEAPIVVIGNNNKLQDGGVIIGMMAGNDSWNGQGNYLIGRYVVQGDHVFNSVGIGEINFNGGVDSALGIGFGTVVEGNFSMALGNYAQGRHPNSLALGHSSKTGREYEASFGDPYFTRYLANVRDGVLDQDAVTVRQLNDAVGNINTLLETLINGEGAKA